MYNIIKAKPARSFSCVLLPQHITFRFIHKTAFVLKSIFNIASRRLSDILGCLPGSACMEIKYCLFIANLLFDHFFKLLLFLLLFPGVKGRFLPIIIILTLVLDYLGQRTFLWMKWLVLRLLDFKLRFPTWNVWISRHRLQVLVWSNCLRTHICAVL